jgi:rhomboid protease GluP
MANCVGCGQELPSLGFGEASNLCANCRRLAANRHPAIPSPQPPAGVGPVARTPYRPPVTVALVGVNVLVFAAMVAGGVPIENPNSFHLLKWGADFGPQSLGAQPWRMLTSNYVHVGIIHLAVNMWGLWQVGRLAERIFGKWTYFLIYTACGIAGSLASLLWNPMGVSAGASGALFGLVGALIGALYLGKLPFPKAALQGLLKNLLLVVAVNLYLGAVIAAIDNAGHVGGLVMGLALGAVVGPQLMEPPDRRRAHERIVFVAAVFLLIGCGIYVRHKNGYVAAFSKAAPAKPATTQP